MSVGKNITWNKGKWKKYHLPHIVKAVGKNIKWRRGTEILGKKIEVKNMGIGKIK